MGSKLIIISASTMGIQTLMLCLLQFLSFFSFVLAIPTEPLRSYVDCSKYGSPHVIIPNGKCFYGPSDWQTYPALPLFVLNEYPGEVDQSSLLLHVQDQDTVPYRFEIMDSTWSGPSENEEFICICYWFL